MTRGPAAVRRQARASRLRACRPVAAPSTMANNQLLVRLPVFSRSVMSAKALSGLRIVEYGQLLSAPWAGRILSDLGAEVIKVEPPGGDIAREWGPFRDGVTDPEQSGLFLFLNSGKKSVVLDLDDAGDRGRFRALCAGADALIHN